MFKILLLSIVFYLLPQEKGTSQSLPTTITTASYHSPATDKPSWQWLNLMLSSTYWRVVKEGTVDYNSCLLYTSRSLGLSRLPVMAEGIDDPELLAQTKWIDQCDPATGLHLLKQVNGKRHLNQLLLLGAYYVFQPHLSFSIDSAAYFLHQAISESDILKEEKQKRQSLCLLGKMYFEVNDIKRADSLFSGLIKECEAAGDIETEARAYFYWALFPPPIPQIFPAQIERFQTVAKLYHDIQNKEGEINALMDAGYLQVPISQLPNAYENFLKSLKLAESIKFPYTHYHTDALSMATEFDGKFGEPLKYSLETIRTAESTRDSIGWGYFYHRLGTLYTMEGQREEESLKWFLKALNRFVLMRDEGLWMNLFSVVILFDKQNRGKETLELVSNIAEKVPPKLPLSQLYYNLSLAKSYEDMQQHNAAEKYLREAEQIQRQYLMLRGPQHKSIIDWLSGMIYFSMEQYDKSKTYLDEYLSNPLGFKLFGNDLAAVSRLVKIDSIEGNLGSAVNHYKKYTRLLDSTYQISKVRQAEELQVMYQTQEKETQINLLSQQAKLEQANLKQATLTRNMTIAGIFIVLVIAALLYRQSRHRQKANQMITQKNEQLGHLLTEKEWLLKEIHHRVKNNLQIVMSLLNSQSAYIDNEPALTAIHDSQHRVHAMSLIHQKLYGGDNVSSIDVSVYVRELVTYLADSFDTGQRIRFEYNIEPLELDVSQAVPIGLILNEAITNAIKYAFPDGRRGIITIALEKVTYNHYLMRIADNGVGMPPGLNSNQSGSLGMSLMQGLSEDLNGSFSLENNNGTNIEVKFLLDHNIKRATPMEMQHVSEY